MGISPRPSPGPPTVTMLVYISAQVANLRLDMEF
eukprot:COSAG02_NODE_2589_length_8471_cov_113.759556_1_plen_34_part_00